MEPPSMELSTPPLKCKRCGELIPQNGIERSADGKYSMRSIGMIGCPSCALKSSTAIKGSRNRPEKAGSEQLDLDAPSILIT